MFLSLNAGLKKFVSSQPLNPFCIHGETRLDNIVPYDLGSNYCLEVELQFLDGICS